MRKFTARPRVSNEELEPQEQSQEAAQSEMFENEKQEKEQVKRCRRCGKVLPVTEFNKSLSAKDSLQSWCKECHRIYYKDLADTEKNSHKLSEYTARDLMNELRRRGYTGELQFTQTIKL